MSSLDLLIAIGLLAGGLFMITVTLAKVGDALCNRLSSISWEIKLTRHELFRPQVLPEHEDEEITDAEVRSDD